MTNPTSPYQDRHVGTFSQLKFLELYLTQDQKLKSIHATSEFSGWNFFNTRPPPLSIVFAVHPKKNALPQTFAFKHISMLSIRCQNMLNFLWKQLLCLLWTKAIATLCSWYEDTQTQMKHFIQCQYIRTYYMVFSFVWWTEVWKGNMILTTNYNKAIVNSWCLAKPSLKSCSVQ